MAGLAIITEACIGTKDRACVDVCPVQCIYEFDPSTNVLFSEVEAGCGEENTHAPNPDAIGVFGDLSCTSTSTSARPAQRAISLTSVRWGRSTPRSAFLTARRPQYNADDTGQGPRPHVLRPAAPGCVRRLTRVVGQVPPLDDIADDPVGHATLRD